MQKVSIWFCLPWPFPNKKMYANFKGCRDCRFLYIHCKSCMYIHSMWLQQCLFCVQRRLRRDWQLTGGAVRSGAWWSSVRWETKPTYKNDKKWDCKCTEGISSVCGNNTSLRSQFDVVCSDGQEFTALSLSVQRATLLAFCFFEFDVM